MLDKEKMELANEIFNEFANKAIDADGFFVSAHILKNGQISHFQRWVEFPASDLLKCVSVTEQAVVEYLKKGPSGMTRL